MAEETLGSEWGALSGFTKEEGLRMVTNLHSELAAENQRLRDEVSRKPAIVEPEPKPEPIAGPDWDTIRGEDKDKAAKELEDYTAKVATDVVDERFKTRSEASFPADRIRAITDARETVKRQGGDFGEFEKQLTTAVTDNVATRAQQTDPNFWVQAYVQLKGLAAMKGVAPTPYVERPGARAIPGPGGQPTNEMTWEEGMEEHEKKSLKNWDRIIPGGMSQAEHQAFRDEINSVEDYENYLAKQREKK